MQKVGADFVFWAVSWSLYLDIYSLLVFSVLFVLFKLFFISHLFYLSFQLKEYRGQERPESLWLQNFISQKGGKKTLHEFGERAHLWHAANPGGTSRVRKRCSRCCGWEEPGVPGTALCDRRDAGRARRGTHTLRQRAGCQAIAAGLWLQEGSHAREFLLGHAGMKACVGATALVAADYPPWRATLLLVCQQVLRGGCCSASFPSCFQRREGSLEGGPAKGCRQSRQTCLSVIEELFGTRSPIPEGVWGVREARVAAPGIQGLSWHGGGDGLEAMWEGSRSAWCTECSLWVGAQVEAEEQVVWNWVSKLWWR